MRHVDGIFLPSHHALPDQIIEVGYLDRADIPQDIFTLSLRVEVPARQKRSFAAAPYLLLLFSLGLIGYLNYPRLLPLLKNTPPATVLANTTPKTSTVTSTNSNILPTAPAAEDGHWLIIPKIGVRATIHEGEDVTVLNEKEGVWRQVGSLEDNLVIAGHRFQYLPPNANTFFNLDQLVSGDSIFIYWDKKVYPYQVSSSYTVSATQTEIAAPTQTPQITLYTCIDRSNTQRLVIEAIPLPSSTEEPRQI